MTELREAIGRWLEIEERSQAWLARKASMDGSYLSMILSGRRTPGPRAIRKLEGAMGLEPGTLNGLAISSQE